MNILLKSKLYKVIKFKEARFLISGLSANILGFVFYLALVQLGLDPAKSLTVLYWSGVLYLYFVNKKFVFLKEGFSSKSFIKFIITYIIGYFISVNILSAAMNYLSLNYIFAMILTSLVMPIYFYLMQRHVVFIISK